jgi:hypothetical protein
MNKSIFIILFYTSTIVSIFLTINTHLTSKEIVKKDNVQQDYETIFNSTISDHYFQQLSSKVETLDYLPEEIKILAFTPGSSPKEQRTTHETFISIVRDYLDQKESLDPRVLEDIDTLSFYILAETAIFIEQQKILHHYLDLSDEAIESKSLPKLILDHFATLSAEFLDKSHYSVNPEKFDLLYSGFLPSKLFTIDSSSYLYMYNPVLVNNASEKKSIDPIFISYLRHLKKLNKKHLYINVMKHEIEMDQLAKSDEFKDVFILWTLDKSSDFYHQEKIWQDKDKIDEFIIAFKQNLFSSPEYSRWPDDLLTQAWEERISTIIAQVQNTYFDKILTLSAIQKGIFIEITYAMIAKELRMMYKPDYINATCKLTMDRGPSQYSLDFVFNLIDRNNSLNTEEKRDLLAMFFISPIIGNNRTSHDYRVNRLSATIETLLTL